MTSPVPAVPTDATSRPLPCEDERIHPAQPLARNQLDEVLRALAIPFDLEIGQWRITEWSDDQTRGLMMPYADPRAYSDRRNDLFTPAGWSRKYAVQASAPVPRSKRGPAAKILVSQRMVCRAAAQPKRNRRVLVRANGHSGNGAPGGQNHGGNGQDLVIAIEAMEHKIGKRLYRGLLKRVARVWTPQQIRETAVLEQVLAQMRGAERGLARLEAAQARLTPETVQGIISSLNLPPAKLENLQTLHTLVVALEQAVESKDLSCLPPGKMTIMTIINCREGRMSSQTWTVAEAKAKFSELLEKANSEGPQKITKHGRTTAVVVAAEEWERKSERKGNLAEFLTSSPLRGSGLKIRRLPMRLRKIEL